MAENNLSIESKLQQAWQQEWRWYCIRGASRFVVWLIALLALDFIIDWGLFAKSGMSGNIGVFLLLVNIGVLGWVLWHEWLRYLKPYDPVATSLEVEKRHPGLTSLLVSYTQLKDGASKDQPNVSQELIDAMRDQAIERSRPIDFKEIVDFGQLKKLLMVAGGVLLVFGVLSIRWNEHLGTLLQRLAGGNAEYPTKTQVLGVSKDLTIRVGASARISAAAGGEIPAEGRLFTRTADSDEKWKELPMKATGVEDTFSRELKGLTKDLAYYVRLGDDRSDEFRIRVIDSPQITGATLALHYPDYMDREPGTSDQLNLEVSEGTSIKWAITCDRPVQSCEVILPPSAGEVADGQEGPKPVIIKADLDEAGTTATFERTADEAIKYTLRREKGFTYESVQYAVKVSTDGLPDVDMVRPRDVGYATVKKIVQFEAKAADDIGLDKAWLVWSVDGADESESEIFDFAGAPNGSFEYSWKLSDTIQDLKPGARVSFALLVADRHPDRENHIRRSATRTLSIVDDETYLAWYKSEKDAQIEELKRARIQELAAQTAVTQLKTEEGIPDEPKDEQPEEGTSNETNEN
jgi:hypothetical protein